MLFRSGRAPWIVGSLLLVSAGCSRRNLDIGDGTPAGFDAGKGGSSSVTDAAPPDGSGAGGQAATGGGSGTGQRQIGRLDAAESSCVTGAIPLPWSKTPSKPLRLAVVANSDAIAVMNRLPDRLDVRTFGHDGTAIGGFQFQADAQLLPYNDDRFLLVSRSTTGDFMATSIGRTLTGGARLATATSTATEHMLRVVSLATDTLLLTDENFVSFASGHGVPWSNVLGTADKDAFKSSRVFGLAAQDDRVLIAWGGSTDLRLAVVTAGGALATQGQVGGFFGDLGSATATAFPYAGGLLLLSGNPLRMTELGFDLARQMLGANTQLRTFQRVTSQVALIDLGGEPVAFWLTVFPGTDASQGATTHQLYGCALDFAKLGTCDTTSLIADTGLGGYTLEDEPVAAAAFPDGHAFAIAHSDVFGQSWLRIGDLGCAVPTDVAP
jgi:hypothetical protein